MYNIKCCKSRHAAGVAGHWRFENLESPTYSAVRGYQKVPFDDGSEILQTSRYGKSSMSFQSFSNISQLLQPPDFFRPFHSC